MDVSKIPVSPRPRSVARKPKWHSMAGDMVPMLGGLEDPQENASFGGAGHETAGRLRSATLRDAGSQPGLSRNIGTGLGRSQILATCSQGDRKRPKSAPGGAALVRRPNSATIGKSSHARARRPQSAPRLLRGDGLLLKRPADIHLQEDKTLQRMEEYSVSSNMESFKHEKRVFKDKVDGVEMLEDPILYDLKVLHNGRQRAVSSRLKEAKNELEMEMLEFKKNPPAANDTIRRQRLDELKKRKMQNQSGTEVVKELCAKLDTNLRKHAKRLDFRRLSQTACTLEDQNALLRDFKLLMQFKDTDQKAKQMTHHEFVQPAFADYFRSVTSANQRPPSFLGDEDDISERLSDIPEPQTMVQRKPKKEEPATPQPQLLQPPTSTPNDVAATKPKASSRHGSRRSSLTEAVAITLAELVGFLIGCCGTVEAAFSSLDSDGDGRVNAQEWETGLQRLGFKDEVACVFRMLGKGPDEGATLKELQALFSPCLESLRSLPRRSL